MKRTTMEVVSNNQRQQFPTMEVTGRVVGIREPSHEDGGRGYGVYVTIGLYGPSRTLEVYVPFNGSGVSDDGSKVEQGGRQYISAIGFGSMLKVTIAAADEDLSAGPRFRIPATLASRHHAVYERWGYLALKGFNDLGFVKVEGDIAGSGGGTLRVVVIDAEADEDEETWIARSSIHTFRVVDDAKRDEELRKVADARRERGEERARVRREIEQETERRASLAAIVTSYDIDPPDAEAPGRGASRGSSDIFVEVVDLAEQVRRWGGSGTQDEVAKALRELPKGTDVSPMYCVEGGVVFQRPVVRANLCTLKHQHGDGASCRPPFRVVNIVKVDGEDGPDAVGCGFVCEGAMREPKNLQLVIDAVKRMGFGAVAVTTVPPNSTLARDVQTTEEAPPGYPNSDIIF